MYKEDIEANLKVNGWKQDRWGHWQIVKKDRKYRVKFGKISCRLEVNLGNGWINCSSEPTYQKDIIIKANSNNQRAMLIGTKLIRMENMPCM